MATVNGVRPETEVSTASRTKGGRVQTQRAQTPQEQLAPAAARTNSMIAAPAKDVDFRSESLMKALSKLNPALESFAGTAQKNTDEDILRSAEYHMERIRKELGEGTVKATQVGELLPEASHTVVSRITQSLAKKASKSYFEKAFMEIEQDDSLRLDTAARNAKLAELREKAKAEGGDDPFYTSGFMEGLDGMIAQNESRWKSETAKYHQDVQAEEFSNKVIETIQTGGDLVALDDAWGETSSLNKIERKNLVVGTLTDQAIATRKPEILDNIPTRFLNAKSKQEIQKTRQSIASANYTEWAHNEARVKADRAELVRGKQLSALQTLAETGTVNPLDYIDTPEGYRFASSLINQPSVDGTSSVVSARKIRTGILNAAVSGDIESSLGTLGYDGDLDENSLYEFIATNPNMNAAERQALINDVPVLMEGVVIMKEPRVQNVMSNILTPALNDLANSTNSELKQLLEGKNLRARTMVQFQDDITYGLLDYYEENQKLPTGTAKQQIINQARDSALTFIERESSLPRGPSSKPNPNASDDEGIIDYGALE